MKKELVALCVAVVAVSGCGNSDPENAQGSLPAGSDVPAAIGASVRNFGEIGGEPWGKPTTFKDENAAASMYLGRVLAVADLNGNGVVDIISSKGSHTHHGQVVVQWDSGSVTSYNFKNDTDEDNFGAAIVAGQFCPELTSGNIIVASAPDYNNSTGGFGLIYKQDDGKVYKIWKRLTNGSGKSDMMGATFAIGDVDKDGKFDIVYQSTPINDKGKYENSKVGVILDFCSYNGRVNVADEITGTTAGFGSNIQVRTLDVDGTPEIIVVDQRYTDQDNASGVPNGAIFFYKFEDGKLVESRRPVIGKTNDKGGEGIVSVAFSDLDRDKDLDMLVGSSRYSENAVREGQVRSFTNPGVGKTFHESSTWSAKSGREDAYYGATVVTADLNFDGYNELIVGAPGVAANANQNITGSEGYVYVYLGTRKGSFSKEAYWTYNSHVPLNRNDQFGAHIAVADLDSAGWMDLIVTAPNYSPTKPTSLSRAGRIDIFKVDTTPCYTANKCLVDGVCYKADQMPEDNKCLVCKPMQNNFDLVPVVCDESVTDECNPGAVCEPQTGCVTKFAEEGSSCGGEPTCNADLLVYGECKQGKCEKSEKSCGNNAICSTEHRMCLDKCSHDSDCKGDARMVCLNQVCTPVVNNPPVIVAPSSLDGYPGDTIVIDASNSYDPEDGQKISFSWSGSGASHLSATDTANPIFSIPKNAKEGDTYNLSLQVIDTEGASSNADISVTVLKGSDSNHPPVVVLNSTFNARPGQSITLDASHSSDPDGDKITYQWAGNGAEHLDNRKSASPKFKVPANAELGQIFDLVLTVTDAKGASSTASTLVNVNAATNQAPVVVVSADKDVAYAGESILLDASQSYDPDGDEITSRWKTSCTFQGEPSSQPFVVADVSKSIAHVEIPEDLDLDGTCDTVVTIIDSFGSSSSSTVTFSVKKNTPPTAVLPETYIYEGEPLLIDGSASNDPDEDDELSYEWKVSNGAELRIDDGSSSVATFVANDAKNGDKFTVTLTVTDKRGKSDTAETTVTYVAPNVVSILSPVDGADVEAEFDISGLASGFNDITVIDRWDREICKAKVEEDKSWTCHVKEKTGRLLLEANAVDEKGEFIAESESIIINVHGEEPEVVPTLTITSPMPSEVTDVHPLIQGVSENLDRTIVNVWSLAEDEGTMLCSATIEEGGAWECAVGTDLAFDTEYTIRAKVTDVYEATSENVTFRTQPETAMIEIITPVESGQYPNTYPIVLAGIADPDTPISIYVGDNAATAVSICEARSDELGKWACDSRIFAVGEYTVFADDASDNIIYPTSQLKFTVYEVIPDENFEAAEPDFEKHPHGGSCSSTPMGGQGQGWLALLAAGMGLGFLRRRKETK